VGSALQNHFVKADTVNEQAAVDAFDVPNWHTLRVQVKFVNLITVKGLFVDGLHYNAWDFEVFRIF
jgi:hypothetical protein